jgi:hypothetical protein
MPNNKSEGCLNTGTGEPKKNELKSKFKYVDISVTEEKLKQLKIAQNNEKSPNAYYKFKTWLHYANLKSWQGQGWHFAYLNYSGDEMRCTCGLAVPIDSKSDLKPEALNKLGVLDLDQVQISTGHRQLPTFEGQVNAFIYDYTYVGGLALYTYHCLCQLCGEYIEGQSSSDAITWCKFHNQVCTA